MGILGEGAFQPNKSQWIRFSFLHYAPLRLLWQKHLLEFINTEFGELNGLVNRLWSEYPEGFYAHPGNHEKVPTKHYQGLLRYLTKYLASPPVGDSRITAYDNGQVTYYYKSHRTKGIKYERVDMVVFIGIMVQHILPKGFQRVRYYGLQATASFKKWYEEIARVARVARVAGDLVDAMVSYVNRLRYADLFE